MSVTNLGDRPIQVGSHYHFIETNAALKFDRGKAYGKRLDIPAGTAVRFEPGDTKTVTLVDIAGNRVIRGGNNLADGPVSDERIECRRMRRVAEQNFQRRISQCLIPISRNTYADIYGPTTGDKVRLGRYFARSSRSKRTSPSMATNANSAAAKPSAKGWARPRASARRRARLRHHQCLDRRLHRHLQGRRRHQGRADRRRSARRAIPM